MYMFTKEKFNMAIEANDITGLKNRNNGVDKRTISSSDYVLRDKKAEAKDPTKVLNTRDITDQNDKYKDELARLKAEARKEVEAELLSSGFMDKLKAEIRAEIASDKKTVGGK